MNRISFMSLALTDVLLRVIDVIFLAAFLQKSNCKIVIYKKGNDNIQKIFLHSQISKLANTLNKIMVVIGK